MAVEAEAGMMALIVGLLEEVSESPITLRLEYPGRKLTQHNATTRH